MRLHEVSLLPEETPQQNPTKFTTYKHGLRGIFSALSVRNFRLYWLGLVTLTFAAQLHMPAQSWLAYELTHSPLKLTLVAAMQAVPMIVFSIYSGVFIDRIQKRSILLTAQSFSFGIAVVVAVLIGTHHIQYWHLLISSFLNGIAASFNMTARYAIVAELVPADRLYNATALNNAGSNAVATAGPAISGILIGIMGVQGAYYAGIFFYLIGIIIFRMLPATSNLSRASRGPILKKYAEGLRYLRLQKAIIIILIMEFALTFFGASYQGLMPVFADLLNQNSIGYGFMLAATGVGAMIGSLVVASLGNFKRKGLVLLITGIALGVSLGLFANMSQLGNILNLGGSNYYLALVLLMGAGFFITAYTTTSNAIVQMNTSDEFRGRVTSFYSMVVGFYPLTTFVMGAMAEGLGAPIALTIGAACLTLFMVITTTASHRIRQLV
jgi:MFS family permease